jgi:guanine nucleotide-binding protein G(i) subunit alpha
MFVYQGAGESGKSTIAKQLKIIFLNGYNKQELLSYKGIIHSNIIMSMRAIVLEVRKRGLSVDKALEVRQVFDFVV